MIFHCECWQCFTTLTLTIQQLYAASQEMYWMNGSSLKTPRWTSTGMSHTTHPMKAWLVSCSCAICLAAVSIPQQTTSSQKAQHFISNWSFINPSLGDVQQVFLGLSCCVYLYFRSNRCVTLSGREFYSSVSKHPEQSQWPSEAEKRPTTNAKLTFFFFWEKKTWNLNTSPESEPSEKTCRDVRKLYQFRKTESFKMFSTEKSIWGAWASKCCWILLSGNGEAGQYHARATCTEQLDV